MNVLHHSATIIYPFQHRFSGTTAVGELAATGRWQDWMDRIAPEQRAARQADTFFFLPYVRRLLFAEPPDSRPANAAPRASVTRLTYAPRVLAALGPLWFRDAHGGQRVNQQINLCWVDVLLFPQQVGFLVAKLELGTPPSIAQFRDTLAELRRVLPPSADWRMPYWHLERADSTLHITTRDLIDYLLQGLTASSPTVRHPTLAAFAADPAPPRFSQTDYGQVYGQTLRLYSYVCVDSPLADQTDPPFADAAQRALYEIATCTPSTTTDFAPHPAWVHQTFASPGSIAIWRNWQGLALHDNVTFLARDVTRFTTQTLPHNIEQDYFYVYLLALFQKMLLSQMFGQSMREQQRDNLYRDLRAIRQLWEAFVAFRNVFWLTEVTFKPQGNELYQRFRQGLGTQAIYDSVTSAVTELQSYYEGKVQRSISDAINVITFVGVPAGIITGLYATNLFPEQPWSAFLLITAVIYGALGIVYLAIRYLYGRR